MIDYKISYIIMTIIMLYHNYNKEKKLKISQNLSPNQ